MKMQHPVAHDRVVPHQDRLPVVPHIVIDPQGMYRLAIAYQPLRPIRVIADNARVLLHVGIRHRHVTLGEEIARGSVGLDPDDLSLWGIQRGRRPSRDAGATEEYRRHPEERSPDGRRPPDPRHTAWQWQDSEQAHQHSTRPRGPRRRCAHDYPLTPPCHAPPAVSRCGPVLCQGGTAVQTSVQQREISGTGWWTPRRA